MPEGDLDIEIAGTPEERELTVSGEIDYGSVGRLRSVLVDALKTSPARVVIDLAGVEFVDSTFLSVVVQAKQRLDSEGGELILANVPPRVRRVLAIAGADAYLGV